MIEDITVAIRNTWKYTKNQRSNSLVYIIIGLSVLALVLIKLHLTSWTNDCFVYESGGISVSNGDLSGNLGNYNIPPLFLWLIGLFMMTGIGAAQAGVLISIISFFGTALIIFNIVKMVHTQKLAYVIVAIFLIHPRFLSYAVLPLRTSLYLFLIATILYLSLRVIKLNDLKVFYFIFFGLSITILRPEGFEIVIISLLFLMFKYKAYRVKMVLILASILVSNFAISKFYHDLCSANWSMKSYITRPITSASNITLKERLMSIQNIFEITEAVYMPLFILLIAGMILSLKHLKKPEQFYCMLTFISILLLRVASSFMGMPCVRRHLASAALVLIIFALPYLLLYLKTVRKKSVCMIILLLFLIPKTFKDRSHRSLCAPFGIIKNIIKNSNNLIQ